MKRFADACEDFGLTISPKKTQVIGQYVEQPTSLSIADYELEAVHEFVYLGSTIFDKPLPGGRGQQAHRESRNYTLPADKKSLVQW